MTRTPARVLKAITERDGHVSAWTGIDTDTLVPQHRSGGMGGGKSKQRLSNVVWLESHINGLIESDPVWAEEARQRGIKVSQHADPSKTAIEHAVHGVVWLDDDGGWTDGLTTEQRE